MGELCKGLQNLGEVGIYRLNCPPGELQESAQEAGFVLFDADLAHASGKGEVLAEFARVIAAPEWFGQNWDALADALCDLSWHPASGYVLVLHNKSATDGVLDEILAATVSFWKMKGKAFWVFFA